MTSVYWCGWCGLAKSEKNGDGQTSRGGARERRRENLRRIFWRRFHRGYSGNPVEQKIPCCIPLTGISRVITHKENSRYLIDPWCSREDAVCGHNSSLIATHIIKNLEVLEVGEPWLKKWGHSTFVSQGSDFEVCHQSGSAVGELQICFLGPLDA